MKMAKERNKNLCFVEQPAGKWSINDRWVGEIECVCVWGGGSGRRPSPDDKCSSLELSEVDSHLCAVARLPHPDLFNREEENIKKEFCF